MKLKSIVTGAATAVLLSAGAAVASPADIFGTFTANFDVTAVNVTNLSRSESEATVANFDAARAGTLGGADSDSTVESFTYSGPLNFGTKAGSSTTIGEFINSGVLNGGSTSLDLTGSFAGLTNSKGNIDASPATATTTFYLFQALGGGFTAGAIDIAHDDGVLVLGAGGTPGPTSLVDTSISFGGGALSFLYVSTNSDPSIFRVDSEISSVPLPAAGWMLLAGLGALGAAARRRKAA